MKAFKQTFIAGLLLLAVFALGNVASQVQQTALSTPRVPWRTVGTITATQATLAVNARDYSAVEALTGTKTAVWDVPDEATGVEIRFQTSANANAHVVEMWVCAEDYMIGGVEDSFALGAILTLTGGQQVGPHSNVFVDTIVATEYVLTDSEVVDSAADRMCIWRVDLRGWKRVVFIATTFQAATTLYVDARWF